MHATCDVDVIDDDVEVREALSNLLACYGYGVREYHSADAFLESGQADLDGSRPLVIISDVRMPGRSGLGLLHELRERAATTGAAFAVILLSGHATVPLAVEAMRDGAIHFLEKPVDPDVLLETVRAASLRLRAARAPSQEAAARARLDGLTPREREVLAAFVARGSNKAVASALNMSPRTVEVHRTRIVRKSGASCVTELVRLAIEAGVVEDAPREGQA